MIFREPASRVDWLFLTDYLSYQIMWIALACYCQVKNKEPDFVQEWDAGSSSFMQLKGKQKYQWFKTLQLVANKQRFVKISCFDPHASAAHIICRARKRQDIILYS